MDDTFLLIFWNFVGLYFPKTNRIKKNKKFLFCFHIYFYISVNQIDKRTDYPGKIIAQKVQKKWDLEFDEPINVVLGNEWNAGNLSYHLKSRPAWEGDLDKNKLDSYNKFICIDNICVGNK